MSCANRHRTSLVVALLLAVSLTPMAMGPGCIPGTGELPFGRFDYTVRNFNCEPASGVTKASIYRLDNGWYALDMSVVDSIPVPFICQPTSDGQCTLPIPQTLPTRLLDDVDLQRITDVFSNLEIVEGFEEPEPCAIDACSFITYEWDDQRYSSNDGICAQGEYTALSYESQLAIISLMESLR